MGASWSAHSVNFGHGVRQNRDEDYRRRCHSFCSRINAVSLLVSRRVLDSAAKMVIRIGPNSGWKLDACAKLR